MLNAIKLVVINNVLGLQGAASQSFRSTNHTASITKNGRPSQSRVTKLPPNSDTPTRANNQPQVVRETTKPTVLKVAKLNKIENAKMPCGPQPVTQ